LVAWIAKNEYEIYDLGTYSDDSFGVEFAGDVTYYKPYNQYMPTNQVKLLELWDVLGIPHKIHKQVSGKILTIIGIEVDANALTLALPSDLLWAIDHLSRLPGTRVLQSVDWNPDRLPTVTRSFQGWASGSPV
jgi:hypothetical protein